MSFILGLSCFYHDSAACLIQNGEIIAAAQEERFTRKKHDSSFPTNSIKFALNIAKIGLQDVEAIVFYEKPFLKFERILETSIAFAPNGFKQFCMSMPLWIKEKLFQKDLIFNELKKIDSNFQNIKKIKFSEHHISHAASAFYPSPFKEALIITSDGVGEWTTFSVAIGKNEKIEIIKEINFPHSLGLLYSAFTYYLGFKVNSGEYKVMGLAPYGQPKYADLIFDNLVDMKSDGSFKLNMKYFNYPTGLTMTNPKFAKLFKREKRESEEELENFHMDIAASIQLVIERIMLEIVKNLKQEFNIKNLCMAGGVALNCVANGKIEKEKIFEKIWIQPASGDAGCSLGAALAYWHLELNKERTVSDSDKMKGSFLGPNFDKEFIKKELDILGANYTYLEDDKLFSLVSNALSEKKAIGWFQGRAEFGPRALGARSIIADPRDFEMQKNLNLKIKFRESFRPFAPAILREDLNDYFELDIDSPYMLFVSNVKGKYKLKSNADNKFGLDKLYEKKSVLPAITHVDYSARIQTVHKNTNERFYKLLEAFKEKTGCPILVNTSFNVRGEPIVNSPKDAFQCFMGTGLDLLIIENFVLEKAHQKQEFIKDYKDKYELD
jgi:carbamoyltransferase